MQDVIVIDKPGGFPPSWDELNDIDIKNAPLPAVYEAAKAALSQCAKVDECQDWANKADALASYARQAKNEKMLKDCRRIKARAIERGGELLLQIEPGKNQFDGHAYTPGGISINRSKAAKAAGLSKRQKDTMLRVVSVPKEQRDALIEADKPPTIKHLAKLGTKPKPLIDLKGIDPKMYARATELQGSLKRLAEFCRSYSPVSLANAFKAHEKGPLRKNLAEITAWIEEFLSEL